MIDKISKVPEKSNLGITPQKSTIDKNIIKKLRSSYSEINLMSNQEGYEFILNGEPLHLRQAEPPSFSLFDASGKVLATAKAIDVGSTDGREGYVFFPKSFKKEQGKRCMKYLITISKKNMGHKFALKNQQKEILPKKV